MQKTASCASWLQFGLAGNDSFTWKLSCAITQLRIAQEDMEQYFTRRLPEPQAQQNFQICNQNCDYSCISCQLSLKNILYSCWEERVLYFYELETGLSCHINCDNKTVIFCTTHQGTDMWNELWFIWQHRVIHWKCLELHFPCEQWISEKKQIRFTFVQVAFSFTVLPIYSLLSFSAHSALMKTKLCQNVQGLLLIISHLRDKRINI